MIDERLLPDWDRTVREAAAIFNQGDLVQRPPFFYAGVPSLAVWAPTALLVDEVPSGDDVVIDLDPADRPPFGIVTSQGCDVADVSRKPWIQIAPVYEVAATTMEDARVADLRRHAVPHLMLLDPPTIDGLLVADLRLEMPIEKSWLAGRRPIAGFADDGGRRLFAQRLAGRLERPALPDAVHDTVVRPLRRWLDRAGTQLRNALAQACVEFRLTIREGSNGENECRLLVIARREQIPELVMEGLERWWSNLGSAPNVIVLANRYCTSDDVVMREYLASVLLDDRFLGEDADVA